jgi:hypothetical protein
MALLLNGRTTALHQQSASFDTRAGFAVALLRMRIAVMASNKVPHPERERSELSKDARRRSSPD